MRMYPSLELPSRCAFIVYDDEREMILTCVSTCGLQKQSNKGKVGHMSSQIDETSY